MKLNRGSNFNQVGTNMPIEINEFLALQPVSQISI